jgi:hypothetical protein
MNEEKRPNKIAKDPPVEYQPESGQPGASRADDEETGGAEGEDRRVLADEKEDD